MITKEHITKEHVFLPRKNAARKIQKTENSLQAISQL